MSVEWVRGHCLALPHVTEDIKWESNLVFSIGGKMFAITRLEPGETWLSFKCTPEEFAELSERPGCRPAPYLAGQAGSRLMTLTHSTAERWSGCSAYPMSLSSPS
ncbi:MAG: MmcQ/YjbR family DNA-binding protein [Acidobacteria bacterium]|nr:MmcQ/YjbR family DNA-binding protein [Acidobacteriota bacterium]